MDQFACREIEACLFESPVGYQVLDALVQANQDLSKVSLEEVRAMVVQFSNWEPRRYRWA